MSQTNYTQPSQPPASPGRPRRVAPIAPIWAAGLGALAFGLLYAALPQRLTYVPSWLPLLIIVIILAPMYVALLLSKPLPHRVVRMLAFAMLTVVTLALLVSVALLVITLPHRTAAQSKTLLQEAALLWLINILVFALWFWEIDGGGPHKRHEAEHQAADLLFPQQAQEKNIYEAWAPHFLDYLFVAFTTATALSPTDTMPLSRKAKALMMIESLIALAIIVLLASRAINILSSG
jgi:hypothetical protein